MHLFSSYPKLGFAEDNIWGSFCGLSWSVNHFWHSHPIGNPIRFTCRSYTHIYLRRFPPSG